MYFCVCLERERELCYAFSSIRGLTSNDNWYSRLFLLRFKIMIYKFTLSNYGLTIIITIPYRHQWTDGVVLLEESRNAEFIYITKFVI